MIESRYWKEDLLKYAKEFSSKKKPPRWSERRVVNFEKNVVISAFIVRVLLENHKLSTRTIKMQLNIYRSRNRREVSLLNEHNIERNYWLEEEELVSENMLFVCNQLIHGRPIFSYRDEARNWGGVFTCSDYERQKYISYSN